MKGYAPKVPVASEMISHKGIQTTNKLAVGGRTNQLKSGVDTHHLRLEQMSISGESCLPIRQWRITLAEVLLTAEKNGCINPDA